MSTSSQFKEYIWLVDTIRRAGDPLIGGGITFKEINKRWLDNEMSEGIELARTTFNRHRDAILHIFGVKIECDRRNNKYYIWNREAFKGNTVRNWMFSTLSVSNMLNENVGLHKRILLEDIPSCDDKLMSIINAMRDNRQITFRYQRYGADLANEYTASPYCVKLFKRRWYVLVKFDDAHEGSDGFYIYSLDRMERVEVTETNFTVDKEFDAAAYFYDWFGVLSDRNKKPESIEIRAYDPVAYYIRDLPLHRSQEEIGRGLDYTDYKLWLRPTEDFMADLMSRGKRVKVLKPQWLADDIKRRLKEAMEGYEED